MQRNDLFIQKLTNLEKLETTCFRAYKCLYICTILANAPIPITLLTERFNFSSNAIDQLTSWLKITNDQSHYFLDPADKEYLEAHFKYKNNIAPNRNLETVPQEIIDHLITHIKQVNLNEVLQKHVEKMLTLTNYREEDLTQLAVNHYLVAMQEQMGPARESNNQEIFDELNKQSSTTDAESRKELADFIEKETEKQVVKAQEKKIVKSMQEKKNVKSKSFVTTFTFLGGVSTATLAATAVIVQHPQLLRSLTNAVLNRKGS